MERSEASAPAARKPGRIAQFRKGTLASLSERDFAWFFTGNVAFFMGMQMQMILNGYIAFDLTDSATALGVMAGVSAVPMLVAGPFGGVAADRVNKRTLLMVTQAVIATVSFLIAILVITGAIAYWHLLVSSSVVGLVFSFNMPARQALVPQLIPAHKLMNAISLQMAGANVTRILAPAAGGLLIAPLGSGWVYLITAILFSLASLSERHLPRWGMVAKQERQPVFTDLAEGFRYIRDEPTIRLLMTAALVMPLFAFPVQQMLPVFAEDVFDNGGAGLGLLAASTGIGGLAGAIISANLEKQIWKGRLMFLGGALMGTFLLAFALSPYFVLALVFLAAMGIGQMLFQATNNTAIQATLPKEVRGRVMSVLMMSFGMMPLGVLPVTLAADAIGAPAAVAISACCLLALLVLMWGLSPRLRNLRLRPPGAAVLSPVQAAALVAEGRITQAEADRLSGQDLSQRSTFA